MLNRARAAVLIVAAISLAACGNIHPGDAAVVDGHSISMEKFDKTARVFCLDALAGSTGATKPDNAAVRRGTVVRMVSLVVARDLADEEGVVPKPSDYEVSPERKAQLPKQLPGVDVDDATAVLEDVQELSLIAVALAAKATGAVPTEENLGQFNEAGMAAIQAAFNDHDVKFAPRFGLSPSLKDLGPTGSLSVANVDFEAPTGDELPAVLHCS
ncbi:MAG: hypothetical protein ABIN55_01890 [Aeromicrobium sp.]